MVKQYVNLYYLLWGNKVFVLYNVEINTDTTVKYQSHVRINLCDMIKILR